VGGGDGEACQRGKGEAKHSGEVSGKALDGLKTGTAACHGVDDAPSTTENAQCHYNSAEGSQRKRNVEKMGVFIGGERTQKEENCDKLLTVLCSVQKSRCERAEKLPALYGAVG